MKKKDGWGKGRMIVLLTVVLMLVSVSAYGEPKLIVKGTDGVTTKFVVTDDGSVGSGVTAPNYNFDLSSQGAMKSSMHFSVNGNEVGGWISSLLDNNFWLSSGAMYDSSLGGWIQKSSDGKSVFAGSGGAGYRVYLQSDVTPGSVIPPVERFKIDYSGNVTVPSLSGNYTNGSAYVCVNNSGVLYTSESGCP